MERDEVIKRCRRVVVKLGTAVLMRDEGGLAMGRFHSFVEAIAKQLQSDVEVIVVTSGAIGLGVEKLKLGERPKLLPLKQACAAVGQGRLMSLYEEAFDHYGVNCAQILLTEEDFSSRKRYLNLRSTIGELVALHVVPVINENDTVSTSELELDPTKSQKRVNFGDNDKLSALVASKMEADLLIILTDVDGVYTADPKNDPQAKLISQVSNASELDELFSENTANKPEIPSKMGRGGMKSKLAAAKVATQSGCAVIIAGGKQPNILERLFIGEALGTLFLPDPQTPNMPGRLRWIAFATTVKASLVVNEGAKEALAKRKASLLPAGVIAVKDEFERGDVVSIVSEDGKEFARGIVNYSSLEARKISGMNSAEIDRVIKDRNYDALVTRDNIAFLEGK